MLGGVGDLVEQSLLLHASGDGVLGVVGVSVDQSLLLQAGRECVLGEAWVVIFGMAKFS